MINFKPYDGDAFELYKGAVERKDNGPDKDALLRIEEKVCKSYETYQTAFKNQRVHLLNQDDSYAYDEKRLMKALYGSKAKVVKDIRAWIDGNNKRTYLRKCPYCTISRANTTEHILPKEKYPEYAAFPEVGFRIAGLYWAKKKCNSLADECKFREITKKINALYNQSLNM